MTIYSALTRVPRWLYALIAGVLFMALLFFGGKESVVNSLPGRASFSKIYHFIFYSFSACLVWLSMKRPSIFRVVALIIIAGSIDEIHQSFFPFREARVSDVLLDAASGICGAYLMRFLHNRSERSKEKTDEAQQ